jgi:CubicO group peptidase (beta-lactamase class C family)
MPGRIPEAGRPDPVTPRTLFQAGSVSKPVAAVCVLRLVAQGHLDTAVNDVLVSWKVPANHGWKPRVTVRQLLSHTAGLTVHGFPALATTDDKPPRGNHENCLPPSLGGWPGADAHAQQHIAPLPGAPLGGSSCLRSGSRAR